MGGQVNPRPAETTASPTQIERRWLTFGDLKSTLAAQASAPVSKKIGSERLV